jgi:flagellar hook assembly protein FlgD
MVATLMEGDLGAGVYRAKWNGKADDGGDVSSGVYFARVESVKGRASARLMVVK